MGFGKKFIDWVMTGYDWEKMERIDTYKALRERLKDKDLSDEEIEELINIVKSRKK